MKIWASSRDSAATAAFAQALSTHAVDLEWVDTAEVARVWIVDGEGSPPDAARRSQYERLQPAPLVAYLGQLMRDLPHPGWAFFKVPVNDRLVAHWVHMHRMATPGAPRAASAAAGRELWRLSPVQLTRWPNLARYGRDLYLIAACSQLLKEPTVYPTLLATGAAPASLDPLLADAWADGILRVVASQPVVRPPATPTGPAPLTGLFSRPAELASAAPGEGERWGLVKRLLSKFAFR